MHRCPWAGKDALYIDYHDREWAVPLHDNRKLFEHLVLEGFQSGLSWLTILRKREAFRSAFADFDVERVARFTERDVARLMADPKIVRNRRKIEAAVTNARACLALRDQGLDLDRYFWDFVDGEPVHNSWTRMDDVPAHTPLSHRIARDMKARGFVFVGPTTIYAHMQASGMVNDHLTTCFRWRELGGA